MQFDYTAKTTTGGIVSGLIEAEGLEQVRRRLRDSDLFPMTVARHSFGRELLSFRFRKPRSQAKPRELLNLTTQLAIMTRSGIDLAGAIKSLARQANDKTLKATLEEVHEDVTGGKSVSDSLRKHRRVFGEAYIASVAAGEASGKLPEVLSRLAQLQRADIRNRSTVRTLLAYPVLLSAVSFLVIVGLVCFVLPQFAGVFAQFDVDLPIITQVLLAVSNEIQSKLWLWVPLGVGSVLGLLFARTTAAGRRLLDGVLLNTAIIRDVTRAVLIGRTFRLLGLMIQSGVPLLEGVQLTRASIQNSLYRALFADLEQDILNGRCLASSLVKAGFVPDAATEMILTAEKTGTLGTVTELMGEHYEEEGEARLRELATVIEPLIIVTMGVVVAVIVLSVMLPMFEIATLAK